MQSVNCEEIHNGKLQMNAAYKVSAEQLIIMEQIIEKINNFQDC